MLYIASEDKLTIYACSYNLTKSAKSTKSTKSMKEIYTLTEKREREKKRMEEHLVLIMIAKHLPSVPKVPKSYTTYTTTSTIGYLLLGRHQESPILQLLHDTLRIILTRHRLEEGQTLAPVSRQRLLSRGRIVHVQVGQV